MTEAIKARFVGGPADGLTGLAPYSPVRVAMVDGEPHFPPRELGPPTDRLLAQAYRTWTVYQRLDEAPPDDEGCVPFVMVGAVHQGGARD
jgi:hypothetical protein